MKVLLASHSPSHIRVPTLFLLPTYVTNITSFSWFASFLANPNLLGRRSALSRRCQETCALAHPSEGPSKSKAPKHRVSLPVVFSSRPPPNELQLFFSCPSLIASGASRNEQSIGLCRFSLRGKAFGKFHSCQFPRTWEFSETCYHQSPLTSARDSLQNCLFWKRIAQL